MKKVASMLLALALFVSPMKSVFAFDLFIWDVESYFWELTEEGEFFLNFICTTIAVAGSIAAGGYLLLKNKKF
ncbi:MAG: hypothetical protein LBT58_00505 [Endomicrobium sp.]|jgi:hypothetical protein|nr:hypothetical protein [Endomicrobium sp.]